MVSSSADSESGDCGGEGVDEGVLRSQGLVPQPRQGDCGVDADPVPATPGPFAGEVVLPVGSAFHEEAADAFNRIGSSAANHSEGVEGGAHDPVGVVVQQRDQGRRRLGSTTIHLAQGEGGGDAAPFTAVFDQARQGG